VLDVWIEPDGSWEWKDEDELENAIEIGLITDDHAAAARAEGERVIAAWPFPTGWEDFRPDSGWHLPRLPEDWQVV
jgi:predicted RNA-binding protein associated with RNAse of E/G family